MNMLHYIFQNPLLPLAVVSLVTLLVYIALRYPLYRLPHFAVTPQDGTYDGPLSVIVVTHNDGATLRDCIEAIEAQQYAPGFEIIVVNDNSDDDTPDIIKLMQGRYSNIRSTFTPSTARSLSHSKLAVTLGVKSARYDWILLTDGGCRPESDRWMATMAARMTEEKDFVLGYVNFAAGGGLWGRRLRLGRLMAQLRYVHALGVKQTRHPFGSSHGNLALRRSIFLDGKGFYPYLNQLGGDDLLLINHLGQAGRCAATMEPDAIVRQAVPALHQSWRTYRLSESEAMRHLDRKAQLKRLYWGLSTLCYWIYLVSMLAVIVLLLTEGLYIPAACALLVILLEQAASTGMLTATATRLGEAASWPSLPVYTLLQPCYTAYYKLVSRRHRRDLLRGES